MKQESYISRQLIKYPLRYGAGAALFLLSLFFLNFRKFDISVDPSEWGQFGDFIGGVLNPIFGLISVVLVAATLRSQTHAASKQAFENQLFTLLNLHQLVLSSIDRKTSSDIVKTGRDCFRLFYKKIIKTSKTNNVPILTAYHMFLKEDGWEIEHYYRTVYHLFKHVKDGHKEILASDSEQKKYYDIIKSQLSQYELVLLWLNINGINKGNWESILNEKNANLFEHLNKAHLIDNPNENTDEESGDA